MRKRFELIALAEQQKLRKPSLIDLIRQFSMCAGQSSGTTLNEVFRPIQVIGAIIFGFQGPKQCIVFQPMFLLCTEIIEVLAQIVDLPSLKVLPRNLEQTDFERDYSLVVDNVGRKIRIPIMRREQSVCD